MIKAIIEKVGISRRHFNYLLSGERNATKQVAVNLARELGGDINVWGYGTKEERQEVLRAYLEKLL